MAGFDSDSFEKISFTWRELAEQVFELSSLFSAEMLCSSFRSLVGMVRADCYPDRLMPRLALWRLKPEYVDLDTLFVREAVFLDISFRSLLR